MHAYRPAIAAATLCATLFALRHGFAMSIACGATLLLGAAIAAIGRRAPMRGPLVAAAIGVTAASVLAAVRPDAPPIVASRTDVFDAVVTDCGEPQPTGLRELTLRVRGLSVEALTAGEAIPVGARIVVRGRLEPPDVARNPGEPSPRELARERGIDGELARAHIVSVGAVDVRDATLWLPRLRAWAAARVRRSLEEPYASIVTGALFGERATLPRALRDEFQETGTTHVLVTAGLHLGVVAALAVAALELLSFGRISSSLIAIVVVWTYALLAGGHLPAMRAATMATIVLGARASGRRALSWNALGLAAIVVVLVRPSSVDGVSFLLSFSCVAAIVLLAKPLEAVMARTLPHPLREAVALTLATQLGTWPVTAATFLTIAPYAPLANALVVPVVGIVMVLGLAIVGLADVPPLAQALANAETTLVAWILAVVRTVSSWPGAHIAATPPPWWTIVVYDLTIVCVAVALGAGRWRLAAALLAAACALCVFAPAMRAHELEITVLDVGQADAIVIRTPAGHVFLVDAGGRLERGDASGADSQAEAVGERIVVPYLLRQGVHHVAALLMTHPHGDHVGGAVPVLRSLQVDALADSGQAYPGHAYQATMALARERGIPVLEPRSGTVWVTDDGVTFRFFGPTLPYITGSRSDINSNSLVFRLEYGQFSMLFMGDAGTETERRLLAAHEDLRSDVIKVGHHGSAYGTTDAFVRAVRPLYAIVSVGQHNLFGHPAPSTIAELEVQHATVYRTDQNGAATVRSDGQRVQVAPYLTK